MSNPVITPQRIRLLLDQDNPFTPLYNALGCSPINLINSQSLQFELLVYDSSFGNLSDSTTINNWSNISSVVIALQSSRDPHNAEIYWSAYIANAAINQSCTVSNWLSGANQHIKLVVPGTQTYFDLEAQQESAWLCIYAQSTDSPPNLYCLAAFPVTVSDSGIPASPGTLYLLGPDNLIHAVTIVQDGTGNMVLAVEQNGSNGNGLSAPFLASPDNVYRKPTLVEDGGQFVITLT